jgi:molecular chaperone DnaK
MRIEAEKYAEADRRRIQMVELKNQFDSLVYSLETTLKDNGDLVREDLKAQAQQKKQRLQAAFTDSSVSLEEAKQRLDEFQQTLFAIGAAVYQQASPSVDPEDLDTEVVSSTPEFSEPSQSATEDDDLIFNFEDETVAADYEAVD